MGEVAVLDEYMSPAQCAEDGGYPVDSVYAMTSGGGLAHVKVGRRSWITRQDWEAYKAGHGGEAAVLLRKVRLASVEESKKKSERQYSWLLKGCTGCPNLDSSKLERIGCEIFYDPARARRDEFGVCVAYDMLFENCALCGRTINLREDRFVRDKMDRAVHEGGCPGQGTTL